MAKQDPLVKAWRDRLARNAKVFRKVKGRWPSMMDTCKRGVEQAVKAGLRPPYVH